MGLFGRRNQDQRQAAQQRDAAGRAQARAGFARELAEERAAGLQVAGLSGGHGGGITHSGPEATSISGQAAAAPPARPGSPASPGLLAGKRTAEAGGVGGPLIQNTGRGQINIAGSVIGGKYVTKHHAGPGDSPKAREADEEREAV